MLSSQNATDKFILSEETGVMFGGYADVHFNQPISMGQNVASLDVHRLVWLMGYKFNDRTTFAAEIEFEHVKEVYVEQAFLNYTINDYMSLKTGLILSPMGIINSYHEPPTFNGVERPNVDKYIKFKTSTVKCFFNLTHLSMFDRQQNKISKITTTDLSE